MYRWNIGVLVIRLFRYIGSFLCGAIIPVCLWVFGFMGREGYKAPSGYAWKSTGTEYSLFTTLFGILFGLFVGGCIIYGWCRVLKMLPKGNENSESILGVIGFIVGLVVLFVELFSKSPFH